MSDRHKGLGALYAAVALLATTGIFAKKIPLSSIDITLYRSLAAAAVLLVIAGALGISLRLRQCRDLGVLVLLGGVLIVHWVTFFQSMQISSVAIGMTALYTYPVFTLVVEAAAGRRLVALRDALVACGVFAGIYTIAPLHAQSNNVMLGMGWGLLSAAFFAIRNVAQRRLLSHYSPICSIFYQSMFGALLLTPWVTAAPSGIERPTGWGLAVLGVLFTAAPHTLLATSLKYLDAKTVAFIGCLQPVLGAVLAAAWIDELPPWNVVIGALLVLSCAIYETLHVSSPAVPKLAT